MSEAQTPAGVVPILGEAGGCPEVEWAGRKWKIGHPVQKAKALLEIHLAAEAVAEVEALEDAIPPQTYKKAFDNTLNAVRGKQYRTWGPGWTAAMEGADGNYLFLLSLLKVHQPDATVADARALLVNKPLATLAALELVAGDFFSELTADLPEPPAEQTARAAEMTDRFLSSLRTICGISSGPTKT